ncbi:MAG: DUF1311 domain-containing protein [Alphaproteobacteria bacterium]|nr:DUF1311 domain-containing protein [Alphaproteobacteria bacterium]
MRGVDKTDTGLRVWGVGAVLAVGLLASAVSVRAMTPEGGDCVEGAKNAKDVVACLQQEMGRQREVLNVALAKARSNSDPARVALLNRMQQAWMVYRDQYCDWRADLFRADKEQSQLEKLQCLVDTTERHAQELEDDGSVTP